MFDEDNRDQPKRRVVDHLVAIATDPTTSAWSARLYLAAAVQLEAERGREPGDDRTALTIATECVKKRDAGPMSVSFRSFLRAWLDADHAARVAHDAEQAEQLINNQPAAEGRKEVTMTDQQEKPEEPAPTNPPPPWGSFPWDGSMPWPAPPKPALTEREEQSK